MIYISVYIISSNNIGLFKLIVRSYIGISLKNKIYTIFVVYNELGII